MNQISIRIALATGLSMFGIARRRRIQPAFSGAIPSLIDRRVAALTGPDATGGFLYCVPRRVAGRKDTISSIDLDVVLVGEEDGDRVVLASRDYVIDDVEGFLRVVEAGQISLNDVTYELTWLDEGESAEIIRKYRLFEWNP